MATKKKASKTTASKRAPKKSVTVTPAAGNVGEPRAMRPRVPASYHFPTNPEGMLDWAWARERLTKSENYVIVTVRPDGRPHAMGMHGVWWENAYYFGTSPATRKAKNLEASPHCIIVSENFHELIIVEGIAEKVKPGQAPAGMSDCNQKKYGWPLEPCPDSTVYKVVPRVVFAFPLKQIATATTKWVFE